MAAIEQTASDLGRVPDTILLHNPECSPQAFQLACGVMNGVRDAGLCRAWGLSTWDPRPLVDVANDAAPDVLMVRAGLAVPAPVLDAAEQLATALRTKHLWGMAPFGGNTADAIWSTVDTSLFLRPGQHATRLGAALAAAFEVSAVERIAVGTSQADHLADLVTACELATDPEAIARYRTLLSRAASVSAGSPHRERDH